MHPIKPRPLVARSTSPTAELVTIRRTDYSDNSPPATQRRYHMQYRSPIYWLLLAATLAIDAVTISWVCLTTLEAAGNLYFSLVCSQISAACIGCCLSSTRRRYWWLSPLIMSVTVAALTAWLRQREGPDDAYQEFLLYLTLWLPQVTILLVVLWLLRQTSFAERWGWRNGKGNWQVSMSQLLAIMTTSAILFGILRLAEEMHQFWVELAAWTANNVTLAIAALVIYSTRWHAILRLGAIIAVSLVLAFGISRFTSGHPDSILVNIIQAVVLFSWLAVGQIAPAHDISAKTIPQIQHRHN
jgi:hypothetical protein